MNKDNHLIFEAFRSKLQENEESADAKKERVQRGWDINKKRWAKWKMENPEAAAKHAAKKAGKEENAEQTAPGKRRLKYDYEWVTAFLPRDLDISNRAAQDKVLDLAFQETLKRLVPNRKNPRLAAQNMFGDEDFPMEIISQYAWYQEHGFPNATEDGWYDAQDAEEDKHKTL
jgi:hypothetical protein